jgi:hypothetical protein
VHRTAHVLLSIANCIALPTVLATRDLQLIVQPCFRLAPVSWSLWQVSLEAGQQAFHLLHRPPTISTATIMSAFSNDLLCVAAECCVKWLGQGLNCCSQGFCSGHTDLFLGHPSGAKCWEGFEPFGLDKIVNKEQDVGIAFVTAQFAHYQRR